MMKKVVDFEVKEPTAIDTEEKLI